IGNIPDAVLSCLKKHKDLGIHSEMFSDGVVDLVEEGCVTNTFKKNHPGKITGSFMVGTRKLFDFVDNNPFVGVGGQVDFIRGAAVGRDGKGKPILAMPSTTNKGESKIVPYLKQGGGVVTTRAHVHYLVTEYGIAYLFGKSLRQRAFELIRIAHPNHREELEKEAFTRLKCMPSL
ncbi:4-hydroxybutyrate coenzyme A transferase, partial [Armadillidium nasatum]